jgi:hypothetical protein
MSLTTSIGPLIQPQVGGTPPALRQTSLCLFQGRIKGTDGINAQLGHSFAMYSSFLQVTVYAEHGEVACTEEEGRLEYAGLLIRHVAMPSWIVPKLNPTAPERRSSYPKSVLRVSDYDERH